MHVRRKRNIVAAFAAVVLLGLGLLLSVVGAYIVAHDAGWGWVCVAAGWTCLGCAVRLAGQRPPDGP